MASISSKQNGSETPPLFPYVPPPPSIKASSLLPRAQVDFSARYGKIERVRKWCLPRVVPYESSLKEQMISKHEWSFMPRERRESLLREKDKIIANLKKERTILQKKQENLMQKVFPHASSSYVEEIDPREDFAPLDLLQESVGSSSPAPESPLIFPDEAPVLLEPEAPSLEPLSYPANPPTNYANEPLIYLVGDEIGPPEECPWPQDTIEPPAPKEILPEVEKLFEKDITIKCLKRENQELREKVMRLSKNALVAKQAPPFPTLRYKQGGYFLRIWLEKDMIAEPICPSTQSSVRGAYTFHGKISFSLAKTLLEGAFANVSLYSTYPHTINITALNEDLSIDSVIVSQKYGSISNSKLPLHNCRLLGAAGISSKLFNYAFVQALSEPLGSYFLVKKPRAESSTAGILHGRLVSIFETSSGPANRSWRLYESEESIALYPPTFSIIGFLGFFSDEALFSFLSPRLLDSSINFYTISTKLSTLPTVSVFNLALWPPFLEVTGTSSKLVSPPYSGGKVGVLKGTKRDVG